MRLSGSIVDLDALKYARNDPADDIKCLLVCRLVKAELWAGTELHLDQHDWLVWLLKLEDWCNARLTIESFAFHYISHVLEAEVHLKVLFSDTFGHSHPESVMRMLHLLDCATLFTEDVDCFLALKQEVYLLHLEDTFHGDDNVGHELA